MYKGRKMKIEIYADGSDLNEMLSIYRHNKWVSGFTTNPTLMKKANVQNYIEFVKNITEKIKDLPVSFEVFSDDVDEMEKQAKTLSSFGDNIYVKIPVTNTQKLSTKHLINKLLNNGIKVNITAVFTKEQIDELLPFIQSNTNVILSIFAGRIADTGIDPKPIIKYALNSIPSNVKVLWASPREVYNMYEADQLGCHIITVTQDILCKLKLENKNLTEYSLETVKMFYDDALSSNYTL
jgi:transaldolase